MPAPSAKPVAVVTGGARRLGAAITLGLAGAGYDVVINHRHSDAEASAVAATVRSLGAAAHIVTGDMSQRADVDALLAATLNQYGRVDLLVANAGAFARTPIATLTDAEWDAMLSANLRTTYLCAQRFGVHMREHGSGCLLAIADVAALRPWAEYLPYNVAKAGVVALVQTLAKELAPQVRVNAIAPGPVLFPADYDPALRQREINRTLLKREGQAANIADAAVALARNDYITGVVLPVDGGRLLG